MPITIKVNGTSNSLVHKMSNGISTATIPDVCKTPTPGGPVPIPYPNIAQAITLSNGTTNVKGDRMMAATKGSKFALSNGDNAGVAGGVKSSTFMKEATWILYSFDVKLNGKNASRFTDKMFHNAENAANLAGELQVFVKDDEVQNLLCNVFCEVQAKGLKSKKNPYPYSKEAAKLAKSKKYRDLFKKHGLSTERSALVSVPKALAAGRSTYAPAAILGRMARKVAQAAAGYSGVFRPIVNVATLLIDAAAGPVASAGNLSNISSAIPAGNSVVRIRPDVSVVGPQGELKKIYDYKFTRKDGSVDSFQNNQDKIYKKATGKKPQEVSMAACNDCQAAA